MQRRIVKGVTADWSHIMSSLKEELINQVELLKAKLKVIWFTYKTFRNKRVWYL